jgi:hypothetical protein
LIGQVITVVILGIILIVFQTFSTTQQSSWAQSPATSSTNSTSNTTPGIAPYDLAKDCIPIEMLGIPRPASSPEDPPNMKWYRCPDGLLWSDPPSPVNAGVGQFGQQPCPPGSPQQPSTTSPNSSPPPRPPHNLILFDARAPENAGLFNPKTFDGPPWSFTYQIVGGQGLVLENIRAGDQPHFKNMSVPHFEMIFSNGLKKVVRFDANCDFRSGIVGPIEDPSRKGVYTLKWAFQKEFANLEGLDGTGTLDILYEILIRSDQGKSRQGITCEFVGTIVDLDCYRFIPKVSFSWSSSSQIVLNSITAYYKLDYGPVGIALDKNEDWFAGNLWYNSLRIPILTHETSFTAVNKGEGADFDSIHTVNPGQTVFVPGCRFVIPGTAIGGSYPPFDCNHIHWRWGASGVVATEGLLSYLNWFPNLDILLDPSTDADIEEANRGHPYLVPGQTIRIAVVEAKDTLGETDPDDPFSPGIVNGEEIARTLSCNWPRSPPSCQLVSADQVRVWYAATVNNKRSDTFFQHGSYVVDLKGEYKIKPSLQGLRSALGSIETGAGTGAPTTNTALNENKVHEIIGHLDQALADQYWLSDGTLVPEQGAADRVFAELSQTTDLMQDVKRNSQQDPQVSQLMDATTAIILLSTHDLVWNTMYAGIGKLTEVSSSLSADDKSAVDDLVKQNEALKSSLTHYAAAYGEVDLANSPQIIDNFRLSWNNTIVGLGEVFSALGIAPPAAIATSTTTTTTATTPTTTTTTNATAAATTTNGTPTTTTTPTTPTTPPATVTTTTLPSITAIDLHPDSVPQFFKCGETPDTGEPTLPGLDVQSSAYTAITDGDANTEILGKAIFDVTLSEPITNGPGPELTVYEIGNAPEPFSVALFSGDILTQVIEYSAVASATGDTDDCGFGVNTAEIDLSDFGLGEGGQSGNEEIIAITGIRVDNQGAEGCCTGADISDVVIVSPTAAAATTTTTTEDVPLLPGQLQQQDDESDAEGEGEGGGEGELALTQCDPSYPDVCIPPPPPDLNCGDDGVPENFQVLPPNPHGFDDEDNDGIGCESEQQPPASDTTEPSGGGGSNDDDTEAESEPSDSGDEDNEDDDTSED